MRLDKVWGCRTKEAFHCSVRPVHISALLLTGGLHQRYSSRKYTVIYICCWTWAWICRQDKGRTWKDLCQDRFIYYGRSAISTDFLQKQFLSSWICDLRLFGGYLIKQLDLSDCVVLLCACGCTHTLIQSCPLCNHWQLWPWFRCGDQQQKRLVSRQFLNNLVWLYLCIFLLQWWILFSKKSILHV